MLEDEPEKVPDTAALLEQLRDILEGAAQAADVGVGLDQPRRVRRDPAGRDRRPARGAPRGALAAEGARPGARARPRHEAEPAARRGAGARRAHGREERARARGAAHEPRRSSRTPSARPPRSATRPRTTSTASSPRSRSCSTARCRRCRRAASGCRSTRPSPVVNEAGRRRRAASSTRTISDPAAPGTSSDGFLTAS